MRPTVDPLQAGVCNHEKLEMRSHSFPGFPALATVMSIPASNNPRMRRSKNVSGGHRKPTINKDKRAVALRCTF
ncbi:MAG: hypothetical protein ACE5G0_01870 [Rhodothermales bacterium]